MTKVAAPTVASARAVEVPAIKRPLHGFALTGVSVVAGRPNRGPDPLLGRQPTRPGDREGLQGTFERYDFYKNGTEAVVLLGGPACADNVDPWRTITNSFRWLR